MSALFPSIRSEPSSTAVPLGARTLKELPVSVTSLEKVNVIALGAVFTVVFIAGSAVTKSNAYAAVTDQ